MTAVRVALTLLLTSTLSAQSPAPLSNELPAPAVKKLSKSLEAASKHREHVWRDTPAVNSDGSVNGYVEIARGERNKMEFNMAANALGLDRVIPDGIDVYPVNYGFVPQTVSFDGDPFDILVLGPPLPGGTLVKGIIVGLMHMDDEKGLDSKVVVSPLDPRGRAGYVLTPAVRDTLTRYFDTYKSLEPGKFSQVTGWGSVDDARAFVVRTHAFFTECRRPGDEPCRLP